MPCTKIATISTGTRSLDVFESNDGGMLWHYTAGGAYSTTPTPLDAQSGPTIAQREAALRAIREQMKSDEG